MSAPVFQRVAVVGLGLLGGSVALAARRRGVARVVVGVSRRRETAERARETGVVEAASHRAAEVLAGADLVVLATPLEATETTLRGLAPHLPEGALVTDVGSVKGSLAERLPGRLSRGAVFVGAHPMAGSHHRGLEHARADLFEGAVCVLTPTAATPPEALAQVRAFWEGLGSHVVQRSPGQHDLEVAWMSHVPHGLAFAFAAALEAAPEGSGALAGAGFRDFTRIARADPELWADILNANRKQVTGPLRTVAESIESLVRLLEAGDAEALERALAAARERLARHAAGAPADGDENPERTLHRSDEDHS